MLKIESFEAGSLRVRNDDSKEEKAGTDYVCNQERCLGLVLNLQ